MAAQVEAGVAKLDVKDKPATNGTTNGNSHNAEDEDDNSDDDNEEGGDNAAADGEKKKKKRKPKKKKKKTTDISKATSQTTPPRVPLTQLFADGNYPEGEIQEYKDDNTYRTTSEECRHRDRLKEDWLKDYRKAAEVHRQVRKYAQTHLLKPGKTLTEICEGIEDGGSCCVVAGSAQDLDDGRTQKGIVKTGAGHVAVV